MRAIMTIAAVALLLACAEAPPTVPPTKAPTLRSPAGLDQELPATFSVNGAQAHQVAAVVNFVAAYNSGRPDDALALLSERVSVSDCDYRKAVAVSYQGRSETERWLRERIADHDQLQLQSIWNQNPKDLAVGVVWSRRISDILKSLGFKSGITPQLGTKVVFDATTGRITGFANGPSGGDQRLCRPGIADRPTAPVPSAAEVNAGFSDPAPGPYVISARNAADVTTLVNFEIAYAAGQLDGALTLIADAVVVSDCDYATGQVVESKGKDETGRWLTGKFTDRDRFEVARLYKASGQPDVIGVVFSKRTSDSLRALGFSDGIRPPGSAKAILTGDRIASLALASRGGEVAECTPSKV
jgi:hypothetical protein